jgi:hypothetical protein
MTKSFYSKLALASFFVSFLIGTVLFLTATSVETSLNYIGIIGIFYILSAFIYNSVILLIVLVQAVLNKNDRKILLISAFIMLLNLPIMILYTYLLTILN